MRLIQSMVAARAASLKREESIRFCKDVRRLIDRPGRAFTLGMQDVKPQDISINVPDVLVTKPVAGHHGVANVFIPCTVASLPANSAESYWLEVKTVDEMITEVHLTLVSPMKPADPAPRPRVRARQ